MLALYFSIYRKDGRIKAVARTFPILCSNTEIYSPDERLCSSMFHSAFSQDFGEPNQVPTEENRLAVTGLKHRGILLKSFR